ncbi:hypothetical protein EHS25_009811 [Saitozyma podzolica]|uniref:Uncharacterized protein n=1 Tax=Saitozyma podzolica TaxID=1890683 RepID=A0A427YK95_9TREE|nr:hypothetical protein EHS25_009811 [Saitozyma podzolica]
MAVTTPPLFTTSPLERTPFSCPFSTSPLSTHNSHTHNFSPATSPRQVRSQSQHDRLVFSDPEPLTFAKMPIPYPTSTAPSTDSEALSDTPLDSSSTHPASRISRSPSLLTCLFQSNSRSACSSRAPSSAGSSQPTPITPTNSNSRSGSGSGIWGCKPILRRSTACASTSTSASEDNGGNGIGGFMPKASHPFNLTSLEKVSEQNSSTTSVIPTLHGRRSCTLKFAVTRTVPVQVSSTAASSVRSTSRSRMSRSPAPVHAWDELPCALPVEIDDESDEDEGYVEDEEGGFTSDEDELGTFAGPSRMRWQPPFRPDLVLPSSPYGNPKRKMTVEVYSTTDDNDNDIEDDNAPTPRLNQPTRGRKVSISIVGLGGSRLVEKCSRHLSPPPPCLSPTTYLGAEDQIEAPPAARSPSAAEFCRRRGSGVPRLTRDHEQGCRQLRGWRSDDAAFLPLRNEPASASRLTWSRKASLPEDVAVAVPVPVRSMTGAHEVPTSVPSRPILRNARSSAAIVTAVPMRRSGGGTDTLPPVPGAGAFDGAPHVLRRSSAPTSPNLGMTRRTESESPNRKFGALGTHPEVNLQTVFSRSITCEKARKGLERALRESADTPSRSGL